MSSMTSRWILGLLACASSGLGACEFPRPADVEGPGDTPGDVSCQLTALGPSLASADDTVTLEGTFVEPMTVNFPGGVSVPATVLGAHRATVAVPALATAGDVTATGCGSTFGRLPFRRASFPAVLGTFQATYDQTAYAQQAAGLAISREGHTVEVVGDRVYVVGGAGAGGALDSVESAVVNADGTPGHFAIVAGSRLSTARQSHTSVVLGPYLYVIGGRGAAGTLTSVERASIAPDGSLGPFVPVPDAALTTAREGHAIAVVGNYLYVVGGLGITSLNSIERSAINVDGTLGPFAVVRAVTLAASRRGHTASVIGNSLYVVGGTRGADSLADIERAVIDPSGSLGPFSTVAGGRLNTARSGHATVVLRNSVYVIGGAAGSGSLASIEQAAVAVDGSLGSFVIAPAVSLTMERRGHASVVLGNYLYVIGGGGVSSSVERAPLDGDGALGGFAVDPAIALTTKRFGHAVVVSRNYLYVLGGYGGADVERSVINTDGSLGAFVRDPSVTLTNTNGNFIVAVAANYAYVLGRGMTSIEKVAINPDGTLGAAMMLADTGLTAGRNLASATVVGRYLYVVGGYYVPVLSPVDMASVERAPIGPDGSLGRFELISSTLTAPRTQHLAAVIGRYLYIVGGANSLGEMNNTVERAEINADDSLGPFSVVPGVTVSRPRALATAAVVGPYLYILGGTQGSNAVERARINPSGSLGTFSLVAGVGLSAERFGHVSTVVGNYLYVLGGNIGTARTESIERATLGPAER